MSRGPPPILVPTQQSRVPATSALDREAAYDSDREDDAGAGAGAGAVDSDGDHFMASAPSTLSEEVKRKIAEGAPKPQIVGTFRISNAPTSRDSIKPIVRQAKSPVVVEGVRFDMGRYEKQTTYTGLKLSAIDRNKALLTKIAKQVAAENAKPPAEYDIKRNPFPVSALGKDNADITQVSDLSEQACLDIVAGMMHREGNIPSHLVHSFDEFIKEDLEEMVKSQPPIVVEMVSVTDKEAAKNTAIRDRCATALSQYLPREMGTENLEALRKFLAPDSKTSSTRKTKAGQEKKAKPKAKGKAKAESKAKAAPKRKRKAKTEPDAPEGVKGEQSSPSGVKGGGDATLSPPTKRTYKKKEKPKKPTQKDILALNEMNLSEALENAVHSGGEAKFSKLSSMRGLEFMVGDKLKRAFPAVRSEFDCYKALSKSKLKERGALLRDSPAAFGVRKFVYIEQYNPQVERPMIETEEGQIEELYPSQAEAESRSYESNVTVSFRMYIKTVDPATNTETISPLAYDGERAMAMRLHPIVKSSLCNLCKPGTSVSKSAEELAAVDADATDPGGYVIIAGKRFVLIPQQDRGRHKELVCIGKNGYPYVEFSSHDAAHRVSWNPDRTSVRYSDDELTRPGKRKEDKFKRVVTTKSIGKDKATKTDKVQYNFAPYEGYDAEDIRLSRLRALMGNDEILKDYVKILPNGKVSDYLLKKAKAVATAVTGSDLPRLSLQMLIENKALISLPWIFGAFGVIGSDEILRHVAMTDSPQEIEMYREVVERSCQYDTDVIKDKNSALLALGKLRTAENERNSDKYIIQQGQYFIDNMFLRHLGSNPTDVDKLRMDKLGHLCHMINSLCRALVNLRDFSDRRSMVNVRIVSVREIMRLTTQVSLMQLAADIKSQLQFNLSAPMSLHPALLTEGIPGATKHMRSFKSRRDEVQSATDRGVCQFAQKTSVIMAQSVAHRLTNRINSNSGSENRRSQPSFGGGISRMCSPLGANSGTTLHLTCQATISVGMSVHESEHIRSILEQVVWPVSTVWNSKYQRTDEQSFKYLMPYKNGHRPMPYVPAADGEGKDRGDLRSPLDPPEGKGDLKDQQGGKGGTAVPPPPRPLFKIRFDGAWIGVHNDPWFVKRLVTGLKMAPGVSLAVQQMSATVYEREFGVSIETEQGRLVYPHLAVHPLTQRLIFAHSAQDLLQRLARMRQGRGRCHDAFRIAIDADRTEQQLAEKHAHLFDTLLYSEYERVELALCVEMWHRLVENGCVQWTDTDDVMTTLVCPNVAILAGKRPKDDERGAVDPILDDMDIFDRYTYALIHPAFAMEGRTTLQHNHFPNTMPQRVIAACAMFKQATYPVGFNHMVANERYGKNLPMSSLRAPSVPAVVGRATTTDRLPATNIVRQCVSHRDTNTIEDATQLTQTARDMGAFDNICSDHRKVCIPSDIKAAVAFTKRSLVSDPGGRGGGNAGGGEQSNLSEMMKDSYFDEDGDMQEDADGTLKKALFRQSHADGCRIHRIQQGIPPNLFPDATRLLGEKTPGAAQAAARKKKLSGAFGSKLLKEARENAKMLAQESLQFGLNPTETVRAISAVTKGLGYCLEYVYETPDAEQQAREAALKGDLTAPLSVDKYNAIKAKDPIEAERMLNDCFLGRDGIIKEGSFVTPGKTLVRAVRITGEDPDEIKDALEQFGVVDNGGQGGSQTPLGGQGGLQAPLYVPRGRPRLQKKYTQYLLGSAYHKCCISKIDRKIDSKGMLHITFTISYLRKISVNDKINENGQKGTLNLFIPHGRADWDERTGCPYDVLRSSDELNTRKTLGSFKSAEENLIAVTFPDFVRICNGISIQFSSNFSQDFLAPHPWDDKISALSREYLSLIDRPEMTWLGYARAEQDAFDVIGAFVTDCIGAFADGKDVAAEDSKGWRMIANSGSNMAGCLVYGGPNEVLTRLHEVLLMTIKKTSRVWSLPRGRVENVLSKIESQGDWHRQEVLEVMTTEWVADIAKDMEHVHDLNSATIPFLRAALKAHYAPIMKPLVNQFCKDRHRHAQAEQSVANMLRNGLATMVSRAYAPVKELPIKLPEYCLENADLCDMFSAFLMDKMSYITYSTMTGQRMPHRVRISWATMTALTKWASSAVKHCTQAVLENTTRAPSKTNNSNDKKASRFGGMEYNAMMQAGVMHALWELMIKGSDAVEMNMCKCGGYAFFDSALNQIICWRCGSHRKVRRCIIPFATLNFTSILSCMNGRFEFIVQDHGYTDLVQMDNKHRKIELVSGDDDGSTVDRRPRKRVRFKEPELDGGSVDAGRSGLGLL